MADQYSTLLSSVLDYKDLMKELLRFCLEHRSGTVFFAMEDNSLARIAVEEGNIINLDYRLKRGRDAIPLIKSIRRGRIKFSPHKTGMPQAASLPPSHEVLRLLSGARILADAQASMSTNTLTPEAEHIIETELVDFLGPMAGMVWREHLARFGDRRDSRVMIELINAVAEEIGDPEKVTRFKKAVQAKLKL